MAQIILASGSPRRKQLLEAAGILFTVYVSDADESFSERLPVEEVPEYIARKKARTATGSLDGDLLIIAADTIVELDGEIIGKPADKAEAVRILQKLSGRTHRVYTGVVLMHRGRELAFTDRTDVHFNVLSNEEIIYYVEKFSPLDKAGAYAIQEWIGYIGVRSINGDYYNVMGLPVNRVVRAIKDFGNTV